MTGKGRCWLSRTEHSMGPDQTTRSLLTPASPWHLRSNLAWGGELGACCVEHLLLFLASMDSVGLADEITGPLILCPRLEGFQASRRVLSSDRHLSAPPVILCGAVNIHRCHLPFLFLGHACTGLAQVTSLCSGSWAVGTPGRFSAPPPAAASSALGVSQGVAAARGMPWEMTAKLVNFLRPF